MEDTIDRIRSATFTVARRGYDKREVDTYLARLADWLESGGGDQIHSETVKHELERIGRKTGSILTAAEDAAQSIRADAEAEAHQTFGSARAQAESAREDADTYSSQTREEADAYALRVRKEADAYAAEVRSEADEQASAALEEAESKAVRMVEEGTKKRGEIDKVIGDLESRRESALARLQQLSSELAGAATEHTADGAPAGETGNKTAPAGKQTRAAASKPAESKPRAEPGQ